MYIHDVCLNIADTLSVSTPIGIVLNTPSSRAFTNSTDTSLNDASKFTSDNASYAVGKNAAEDTSFKPEFCTHSLLLSGQIGVNFYMDLSGLTEEQRAASWMEFTVSGKGGTTAADAYDAGHTNKSGAYYGYYAQQYFSSLRGFSLGEGQDHEAMPAGTAYTADDNTALADGAKTCATEQPGDGRYRIHIPGISTHELAETYTVTVTTDSGAFDVSLCALSYVTAMLNNGDNAARDNALVALYRYYDSAMTFAGRAH